MEDRDRRVSPWATIGVAIAAALISVGRILLTNPSALTDLLWAEDGLFPLCVRKAGMLACIGDSYAGYLPFMPRMVANVVAPFPLEYWPLVANLTAALEAGLAAGFVYWILRQRGASTVASSLVALLLVVSPIVGVEVLNVAVNSYLPLLYVSTIALAFPPRDKFPTVIYAVILLVTALTIPSSIVLLVAIGVQVFRKSISMRNGLVIAGALVLGLIAQLVTVMNAPDKRPVAVDLATVRAWLDAIPQSLATFLPGLNFLPATDALGMASIPASPWTGALMAAALTLGGIWLAIRGRLPWSPGYGIMLLMGVGIGAIPSITGYVSNRYFVVPALLWFAVAVLALDERLTGKRRIWAMGSLVIVLAILWWPSMKAADVRALATPPWSKIMGDYQRGCAADPNLEIVVMFSPFEWPQFGGPGISSASIRCPDLRP